MDPLDVETVRAAALDFLLFSTQFPSKTTVSDRTRGVSGAFRMRRGPHGGVSAGISLRLLHVFGCEAGTEIEKLTTEIIKCLRMRVTEV